MTAGSRGADAIVIGGGLHGCATAMYLARAGLDVILVEKDCVGRHASSANAGGVRRLGRALAEIPLANAALDLWQHIADLVDDDCGFTASCQVKVAENEREFQAQRKRHDQLLELGYSHEEIVDRDQLRELVPAIAPHCVGALVVRGDGHASPFQTVRAFRRKAEALGVRILEGTAVDALQQRAGHWQITTPAGNLESPVLVNCAGAWGGELAALLGEPPVPLQAQAFMLMITARIKPFVKPVVGAQGRKLSFKQFDNGTLLIGGGHRGRAEPQSNRTHLDFRQLATSAATAQALFPNLRGTHIVRCWAGIEGELPDGIPVIGASALPGVYHAFGFCGHGFALAPIVGSIIADLIVSGETELAIDPFAISRFATLAA